MSPLLLTPTTCIVPQRMRFSYPDGSTPLDGYTIERGIGAGGFGEVYCAVSDAGKRVALKKIQRNLDIELRGVRHCINLRHVNLISLWDIRTDGHGESWVVMEYVPGPSLRDVLRSHPLGLPEDEVKRWFLSTASGVAYLHHQGIVHRDLKPGNIFLDEETHVIKIGDYGLSKFISASRRSGQTESVGTFHYMAPEIGRGVYGKEIDIYALGVILFEILTGDLPFDGESTQEIIMKHLTEDPRLDRVPAGFRAVINKALQKDPEYRYHSVPEMLLDVPWPEVVENCQRIISQNAVGPILAGRKAGLAGDALAADHSTHDHVQGDNLHSMNRTLEQPHPNSPSQGGADGQVPPANPASYHQAKLPPAFIISGTEVEVVSGWPDEGEIIFGPLRDLTAEGANNFEFFQKSLSQSGRINSHRSRGSHSESNPASLGSDSFRPSQVSAPQPTLANPVQFMGGAGLGTASNKSPNFFKRQGDEPIAQAFLEVCRKIGHWWVSGNVSVPIKLLILVLVSIIAVKNSDWLLPLTMSLGLIYLVYCLIRSWWTGGTGEKKISRKEAKRLASQELRLKLQRRPIQDRTIELLASLLLSAFACLVFNLLGLSLGGSWLQSNTTQWAIYAWMASTSIFACWGILLVAKLWEDRVDDISIKRVALLIVGTLTGLFSFCLASLFGINLGDTVVFGLQTSFSTPLTVKGMPLLPAYLIYFSGLFAVLRWWLQADPLRPTRLSMISVSLCLIWASLFSGLLELPVVPHAIMAVVTSVSIQLASPWISLADRFRVAQQLAPENFSMSTDRG